ncbi:hypothetical protein [Stenotrophomonas maltophilia]|uniref:hypothetical protein n=1 Tax=Stenotrophomonas maltophilia TaxID=40324 RepID=UPI0039C02044
MTRLRIAWAAVALFAAVVVPLRIAEIHQAHADRDAAKARWAATSSVRGSESRAPIPRHHANGSSNHGTAHHPLD